MFDLQFHSSFLCVLASWILSNLLLKEAASRNLFKFVFLRNGIQQDFLIFSMLQFFKQKQLRTVKKCIIYCRNSYSLSHVDVNRKVVQGTCTVRNVLADIIVVCY